MKFQEAEFKENLALYRKRREFLKSFQEGESKLEQLTVKEKKKKY
jgi:hypothetical protein